jgi:superfamily I DNA and/or RNA helicase
MPTATISLPVLPANHPLLMAALALKPDAPLIVVGDHRQMPPIVKHDWDTESRRTFRQYQVYASLFDTLRLQQPPMIQFAESFRLHEAMAEFLREEVYRHDGIAFHSKRKDVLPHHAVEDDLVAAVLRPEFPLVVVVHAEADSQVRTSGDCASAGFSRSAKNCADGGRS